MKMMKMYDKNDKYDRMYINKLIYYLFKRKNISIENFIQFCEENGCEDERYEEYCELFEITFKDFQSWLRCKKLERIND